MTWYGVIGLVFAAILAIILLYLGFLWVVTRPIDPHREYESNSPFYHSLLVFSIATVLKFARIHVHVTGAEKFPQGRFLYVGNHRSRFDPMIACVVFKAQTLLFVSKPENFGVPIFGRMIRKCGFMAIDRDNPRNALVTIQKAARMIENDIGSVGIYPEGTRNKAGKGLLPLHNGSFKIAQLAKVPIVTVVMTGTERIHERSPFRRVDVQVTVADVIPADEVCTLRRNEIGERVKAAMEGVLAEQEGYQPGESEA